MILQAQAIALSVQGGQFGGYGLKITGDQCVPSACVFAFAFVLMWLTPSSRDTLLANVGT